MLDDGAVLLRAILTHPYDDLPRGQYADWLLERAGVVECGRCQEGLQRTRLGYMDCPTCHGRGTVSDGREERAEFIRVQCELAKLEQERTDRFNDDIDWSECTGIAASWCPNCGDCVCPYPEDEQTDPRCPLHNESSFHCCLEEIDHQTDQLRQRERELLEQFYRSEFPTYFRPRRGHSFRIDSPHVTIITGDGAETIAEFDRGFIHSITTTFGHFQANADAILAEHPVRSVTLTSLPNISEWADLHSELEQGQNNIQRAIIRSLLTDELIQRRYPGPPIGPNGELAPALNADGKPEPITYHLPGE